MEMGGKMGMPKAEGMLGEEECEWAGQKRVGGEGGDVRADRQ